MNFESEISSENQYDETIKYLFSQLPVFQNIGGSAYKEGLSNTLVLDEYFSHPHQKYKTIHIAGTNGKGSTSHLIAAVLQQSGYKVGLYTSPHLIDFRERIRINGEKISKQYVVDFVANHKHAFEPIHPSFFELTMMMAFLYFADNNIDVAVIETGLGGRLDSTNIITPDLSVITNISFDHIQFLGNSLEAIAREKAGIIKKTTPVIIGESTSTTKPIFEHTAEEIGTSIYFAEDNNLIQSSELNGGKWIFQTSKYPNLKGQLSGYAQIKNASTVLKSIELLSDLGYEIPDKAVYDAFEHVCQLTGLMGRWQVLGESPRIICDTGHNVAGIQLIVEQLSSEAFTSLHIVLGVVNDKDITSILKLLPTNAIYYFTNASINRALLAGELAQQASKVGLHGNIYDTVEEAVYAAKQAATAEDLIFIGGSNFIVGEVLTIFQM